jgi:muconolactone delta-isomerase
MRYLVRGEFTEESPEGRTPEESDLYFQLVVRPSIEALWKLAEEKKAVRGVTAGERESVFVVDADSSAEVERLLNSLPFRGSMKWTVSPIQSLKSALDQHRKAVQTMRAMTVGR